MGAIVKEQVGFQEHRRETKQYGLYPGSADQPTVYDATRY